MAVLSFIFFAFLGVVLCVGCVRMATIAVKAINCMFDKLEGKFDQPKNKESAKQES